MDDIYPLLIGKPLKDENGKEIGRIISSIVDAPGNVREYWLKVEMRR
ncbi:MAG: hypothetical protein QXT26_05100 [Thermoproteota archaeon]